MELIERLDAVRERWDVLRHPFYMRWSEGELTREELAFYAGEYRHAVVALAAQARAAAREAEPEQRDALQAHASEELGHVELWDRFADALASDSERAPLPTTTGCIDAWTAGSDLLERLAVLYAIEASQPPIAQTKLSGLQTHYGMADQPDATAYFTVHAQRDHDHAAHSRELLAQAEGRVSADRLVERAEAALEGNWRLLDGVEERCAATTVA